LSSLFVELVAWITHKFGFDISIIIFIEVYYLV